MECSTFVLTLSQCNGLCLTFDGGVDEEVNVKPPVLGLGGGGGSTSSGGGGDVGGVGGGERDDS